MNKTVIPIILLIFIQLAAYSQQVDNKEGTKIYNKNRRLIAILMKDTSSNSGNRFLANQGDEETGDPFRQFPSVIVDSLLFYKCEEALKFRGQNVYFFDDKRYNIERFIRLYIGYKDLKMNYINVVVQFITKSEFLAAEYIYNKGLFLIVGQRRLRFATVSYPVNP